MPASPDCKPWCDDHSDEYENACRNLYLLYKVDAVDDAGHEDVDPQLAALKEQSDSMMSGLFPDQVDTIFLDVKQDLDEDEQPTMMLKFWDSTKDEDSAQLEIDLGGLEELHAELGAAIEMFR